MLTTTTTATTTIAHDRRMTRLVAAEQARVVRAARTDAVEHATAVRPTRTRHLFRRRASIAFDM